MTEPVPLLLLPGMLCDDAFWAAQTGALADIARPIVIANTVLDSFAAMAERVLSLAPPIFALAGHSMGGRVALEVCRKAPERVAKLALLATDYRGHADAAARQAEAARRDALIAVARAEGMAGFARMWVRQILAPADLDDRVLVDAVVTMMARQSVALLEAQTLAALARSDYAPMLPRLSCPTLICAGDADALRPVAVHREMAALIPHSRLVVIAGSGHMVAMERPEAVTRAMRDWLLA